VGLSQLAYADTFLNICDRGSIGNGIVDSIRRTLESSNTSPENSTLSCDKVSEQKMKKLKVLDIASYCNFNLSCEQGDGVLPKNAFDGLTNVETLDLRWSQLTEVYAESFKGLINLKELRMESSGRYYGQPKFEKNPFRHLKNLKKLYFFQGELGDNSTFDSESFFKGLISLEELDLYGNNVQNFHEKSFSELPKLKRLSLGGNNLQEVPSNLFSNLPNLEWLDFSGNRSNLTLPVAALKGLRKLKTLHLSQSRVREVVPSHFQDLQELEILTLDNNSLNVLPKNIFKDLGNLKELTLYNNHFSKVSRSYIGVSDSVKIDILTEQ